MDLALLAVTAVLLASAPPLVDAWAVRHGASPAALVALALVTLSGLAALPLAFTLCVGLVSAGHGSSLAARIAAVAGLLVVGLMVGRAVGTSLRMWRTRSQLRRVLHALAPRERQRGVRVLPVADVLAFCSGTDAVVSHGLLQLLPPLERQAVVEHEREHASARHGRLIACARAARHAMFGVMPARLAERALERELDALADRAAAERLGDAAPVREALERLTRAAPGQAGSVDAKERIDRLGQHRNGRRADGLVALVTLVVATLVVVTVCAATHAGALWLGAATCALAAVGVASTAGPALRSALTRAL